MGIVGVVSSVGVKDRESFVVWHVDKGLCVDNLFADVAEEGVGRPASNDHDGVDRDLCEVHHHGGPGAKGVGDNLAWFQTEFILSHNKGGRTQFSAHVCARDVADSA